MIDKKIVIGLMGDKSLRKKVAKKFVDAGFYRVSVKSKTTELAKYLLPGTIFPDETLQGIRDRGYKVSKCYWINLLLASVPESKNLIIIDDLQEKDLIEGVITPYTVVCNEEQSDDTINADSENLEAEIHRKIKRIATK